MDKSTKQLGPLQQTVLDFVWENTGCTVRQCLDSLNQTSDKGYAYTTIQTIFDVLHKKGLVVRRRRKNAYVYSARKTKSLFLTEKLAEVMRMYSSQPAPVASSLVDALEDTDPAEIASLIAELRNRGHIE